MRIDILYFDGCPNYPGAAKLVRDVVQVLGLDATIQDIEVRDEKDAARLKFFGSPTIRVNGQDVDPAMRSRTDYAFGCRMYDGSGSPPRALIERALREAVE